MEEKLNVMPEENGEQVNNKPGILLSFLQFFYGNFVVLVLGFVSLPLITRVLSTKEYGRTSLYLSLTNILYIFAILGLDQAYIRFFHKDEVDARKLLRQCLWLPVIIIIALDAIYLAGANFFNQILFEKTGIDITLLVVVYTLTAVVERFLFLQIRMEQRGRLYSNLNILSKLLYILCILLFAKIYGDDFRVGLYALTMPLVIVTGGLAIRYIFQGKKKGGARHSVKQLTLLKYGLPFIPMLMMEWCLASMDKWSIRFFHGFAETGVYSAAMQIMTILLTFRISFVAFWSPIAMEKYEKEKEHLAKGFFADVFQIVQFLCVLAAFGLTSFRQMIVLILGPSYREAVKIIPFLSLMPVLAILYEMTGQGIKFKEKTIYFNYAAAAAIVMNLAGNIFLVPRLKGVGAALATALTYLVYFAIGSFLSNRCYQVSYQFTRLFLALALYIAYAFFATFSQNEWLSFGMGIASMFIVCVLNYQTVQRILTGGYHGNHSKRR